MLSRSAQRDCRFAGIGIEGAIAQILDYLSGPGLIGAFIINLLVEHGKLHPFCCSVPDHIR
jgi:hypothetical protein